MEGRGRKNTVILPGIKSTLENPYGVNATSGNRSWEISCRFVKLNLNKYFYVFTNIFAGTTPSLRRRSWWAWRCSGSRPTCCWCCWSSCGAGSAGTWYMVDNNQKKTRKRLTKMLISPPSHSLQLSTTTGQFCSSENSGRVVSIAVASWQTGKLAMQYYGNAWLLHSVNCSNYTEYSKHRPLVPIQNMLWKLISAWKSSIQRFVSTEKAPTRIGPSPGWKHIKDTIKTLC